MTKKPKLTKAIRDRMDADPAAEKIRALADENARLQDDLIRCQMMYELAMGMAINKSEELRDLVAAIRSLDMSDPYGWRRAVVSLVEEAS